MKKKRLDLMDLVLSRDVMEKALAPYSRQITDDLLTRISSYYRLLAKWNQKISLTSLQDPVEILKTHFGESLFAVPLLPTTDGRLADVGSGAGFPGMVLKLCCPMLKLTLIEANGKKAVFLSELIRALEVDSATVFRGRMEQFSHEPFDIVTCRAVGHFDRLLRWAADSVRKGGAILLWTSAAQASQIVTRPGWSWKDPVHVPESRERCIVGGSRN